jgi:hypothetical protein
MDDATKARIVEAGARAMVDAEMGHGMWDRLQATAFRGVEGERDIWLHRARACLSAALALAEQEGVIFTRVPELRECHPAAAPGFDAEKNQRRVGYNEAIRATLAAKVAL